MSNNKHSAPVIMTHYRVDIDNVLSILALVTFHPKFQKEREVRFVEANWNGLMPEDAIALDIEAGGRGIKGKRDADGTTHSCFAEVVARFAPADDQKALAGLVRIIDTHDAYGEIFAHFCPGLDMELADALENSSVLGVFRSFKGTVGRGERGDYRMLESMQPIFEGILKNARARVRAEQIIQEGKQVRISQRARVALVDNVQNHRVMDVLFKQHGIRAAIYRDGNNLGVLKPNAEKIRVDHPKLIKVIKEAGEQVDGKNGWFAHTGGFLLCRGSSKNMALSPSKVDPNKLFMVLESIFV